MISHRQAMLAVAALIVATLAALPVQGQEASTYYGDGSDGAIIRSASTTESTTVIVQATTYTVNAGVTMTCSQSAGATLLILATVSIDIQGTLDCNGRGSSGGVVGNTGASGVGGSGAGSTGTASVAGGVGQSPRFLFQILECAATGGSTMGAGGGGGGAGDTVNVRSGGGGGGSIKPGAVSGAAGTTTALGGSGGAGGNGGGGIYLVAPSITIGAAGALKADGANGVAGTSNSGGGGGGAGGVICLWSRDLSIHASATISAKGGNGGNGGGTGATGGTGGTIASPTPTAGSAPTSTGGGGGGGGAGGLLIKKTGTPAAYASLLATTGEPAGANCAAGGHKVTHGLDNGDGGGTARDGVLQAGEVDGTDYVCNGTDGLDGADGPPGPIGINWMGQWDDDTSYSERDAVHYAGSAWYCLATPCDNTPAPGGTEWDFIANADGNVIVPSSIDLSFSGDADNPGFDFWIMLLFWIAVLLFSTYMGWLVMAAFALPGLLDAIIPSLPFDFATYLVLCLLGFVLEIAANRFQWGGYASGRRRLAFSPGA